MKQRILFFLVCIGLIAGSAYARTIKGTVIEASTNEPIVGASVFVKGTQVGASTNIDGQYTLNVPDNAKTLSITYIGMVPQEVPVADNLTIKLQSQASNLDEVVVVAYGTQKKSSITGAITQVDAKEIERRPVSSVVQALEGATSGITVTGNYGQPGNSPTVVIRGVGTVKGTTSPLYVIDGVPFGGNITDLNPDDIASMSVLKDAASAALYGNRASNGVILITTKKANKEKVSFNFKTSQGWYVRGIPEYDRTNAEQFMKVEYRNRMSETLASKFKGVYNAENMAAAHELINKEILDDRLFTNVWNAPDTQMYSDIYGNLTSNVMKGSYAEDLDWWDQSTRAGYRADYNFSGSGATEKSDYYFSLGYLEENGFMNKSGFNRFSGRAVVNVKPVSWFKTGFNLNASHQNLKNSKGNGDDNTSYVNPVYYSRYQAPIYPVHLHDAATGQYVLDNNGDKMFDTGYDLDGYPTRKQNSDRHCIYENELNSSRTVRNTMNGIITAEAYLPYGFTAIVKGSLNTRTSNVDEYTSAIIGDGVADHGRFKRTSYRYKEWSFQEQLRWNYTIDNKHYIEALVGHENFRYNYDYQYTFKKNESFPGVGALANFATVNSATGYQNNYATESYLARVQYNFDDRYNLEAAYRRDGSSRFAKGVRWGNFGSVGANWVFSNEEFMKQFTWLNSGKLRVDWGHVANDGGASYYSYLSLYDTSTSGTNAGQPAYWASQIGNPDLFWETGESWGVGLETRLFDRWNFGIEFYNRTNTDLLFDLYNPLSSGSQYPKYTESVITVNLGKMENRGIEINTDVDIVKTKDWTFNFGMNLTTIRNRVVELPSQNSDGIVEGSKLIKEGKSRYSWYTYHYEGVDMMNGRALYTPDLVDKHIVAEDGTIVGGTYKKDENGAPTSELTSTAIPAGEYILSNGKYYVYNNTYAEKNFRGHALPQIYGAFNPSVRYKNFNLSAVITWSLGGKIMDSTYQSLMTVGSNATNYHVDILNSWYGVPEGMTEDSPNRVSTSVNPVISQTYSSFNNATSDRFLTSRDYLVFKNLNASYTLPKSLVNKISLQNVIVSFAAENLFTKTSCKGLDAQQVLSGNQYNYIPSSRVFTFALSVTM